MDASLLLAVEPSQVPWCQSLPKLGLFFMLFLIPGLLILVQGRTASRAASRALASQQQARRARASPAPSSGTATPPPSVAGGAASTEGGVGTGSSGGLGVEGAAEDSSEESDDEIKVQGRGNVRFS